MMPDARLGAAEVTITRIERLMLRVLPKSEWIFVRVTCNDGMIGVGEATMEGHEAAVCAEIDSLALHCKGRSAHVRGQWSDLRASGEGNPHRYTAFSALEQALWDAEGKRCATPLAELLSRQNHAPRLYANINRQTTDRSPEGFAAAAHAALEAGFEMVKIAPFDGLDWTKGRLAEQAPLYHAGIERISAVRDALGPEHRLAVDCHWRFDPATAAGLIADITPMALYWLECPIAENPETRGSLRQLRSLCNRAGTMLAGLESLNGLAAFLAFLEEECYDVIMPDVKYAGGIAECRRIAQAAQLYDVLCSPHNPTGPICHAASLHLAAGLPNCPVLEHQFRETPLFDNIVNHAFPSPINGYGALPEGPGLGVTLSLPAS